MSLDLIGLILQAGIIVKLVLLILVGFSVVSWTIIYTKRRDLKLATQDSEAFVEIYHEGTLEESFAAARDLDRSPLAAVFVEVCTEMSHLAKRTGRESPEDLDTEQMRTLARGLAWSAQREAQGLERGLSFLATTASASPFIGLFGTVVGIINTFQQIGIAGNATLAVVGPGIAEALIATAVGLFAAIPATIAYNHFVARIEDVRSAVDLFVAQFEDDLGRLATLPAAGGQGVAAPKSARATAARAKKG